ncbi:hypothetical protein Tco_0487286 [Tanacetum coccineum]
MSSNTNSLSQHMLMFGVISLARILIIGPEFGGVTSGNNPETTVSITELSLPELQGWKPSGYSFPIYLHELKAFPNECQNTFLNGKLKEEVYVKQPSGFESSEFPDYAYYAGCNMDRKITSGACQLQGGKLVCWSAKKQQSVAMSFAKAEYVAAARCCANVLWMKNQLSDYDIQYKMVPIFCENTNSISISNNLVLHSRTKHIDIRYHFIRDHILKGDIELHFIPTEYQLADIFIKPLDELTFTRLKAELGMLNIN